MIQRLSLLVSWPYLTPRLLARIATLREQVDLMVDCGAIRWHAKGEVASVDEYCRFIEGLPVKPWGFLALDVIGDPKATRANYRVMRKRGFAPMPVFTRNEAMPVLGEYIADAPVVAIGGIAKTGPERGSYIARVMQAAAGHPLHLLGVAKPAMLTLHRPYSADSTSWNAGDRYARWAIYMGRGKFKWVGREHFAARPDERVMEAIRALGFDPHRLMRASEWRGAKTLGGQIGAVSWLAFAADLERHVGTKLFLAAVTPTALQLLDRLEAAVTLAA